MSALAKLCATLGATGASLAAIAYLAASDPKRRRVFRLGPLPVRRRTGAALAAVLLPGAALAIAGHGAGFVIWFGATSVGGWAIAATSPDRAASTRRWGATAVQGLRDRLPPVALPKRPAWIGRANQRLAGRLGAAPLPWSRPAAASLEARVARLEAEVAELRRSLRPARPAGDTPEDEADDIVVELAGGRRR